MEITTVIAISKRVVEKRTGILNYVTETRMSFSKLHPCSHHGHSVTLLGKRDFWMCLELFGMM